MSAGFYRVDSDGQLLHAASGIATPTGSYLVAEHGAYTYPIDVAWRYFSSEADALAYHSTPAEVTLTEYASDKRWRVETGGLTVNGVAIPTDDRAKLLLLGAAEAMADGSSAPLVINGVNYGLFTKVQFQAINAAVVSHVQATFATLSTVLAGIQSGAITTREQIDAAF